MLLCFLMVYCGMQYIQVLGCTLTETLLNKIWSYQKGFSLKKFMLIVIHSFAYFLKTYFPSMLKKPEAPSFTQLVGSCRTCERRKEVNTNSRQTELYRWS